MRLQTRPAITVPRASMIRHPIRGLPLEIIEIIISFLPERRDVYHLALVCRSLSSILNTGVIYYREVVCSAQSFSSFLYALSQKTVPLYRTRVIALGVSPNDRFVRAFPNMPKRFRPRTEGGEEELLRLLRKMPSLHTVKLLRPPSRHWFPKGTNLLWKCIKDHCPQVSNVACGFTEVLYSILNTARTPPTVRFVSIPCYICPERR